MQTTLHLLKKDLRHTRVLIAVWLALVALQCVLTGSSVHPGDRVMQAFFSAISIIVPLFQLLMLIIIIPVLVQEEPLVGTTAFWFTRPISRPGLLGAKALFAAMLVLLPLLAEMLVLACNGVTRHDLGLAVPEIVLAQVSVMAVIATIAALTPTFGRFAVAGGVWCVGWTIAALGLFWLRTLRDPNGFLGAAAHLALEQSRGVAVSVLFAVGGSVVISHQYLTRKTARSVILASAAAAGAIAIMGCWPWNFLAAPPAQNSGVTIDPATITLSLGRSLVHDLPSLRGGGAPPKAYAADIRVAGLPAGVIAIPRQVHPHLSRPEGAPITVQDPTPFVFSNARSYPDSVEYALGGTPILNRDPGVQEADLFGIEASLFNQYADQPLRLSADIDFVASKYVVAAEMPVVQGSRYDHGSDHVVITDVLQQGAGLEILMHEHNVRLLFARSGAASYGSDIGDGFNRGRSLYVLANQKRHEALFEKQGITNDFGGVLESAGKQLVQHTIDLSFGPDERHLTPDLTESWLADAKLVRLELVPVAEFSKQLTVEKLRLNWPNAYGSYSPAAEGSNLPLLANIELPAHPTKAQVKEYVDAILAVSQRRRAYKRSDPQVGMLAKVGSENLDILLEAGGGNLTNPKRYLVWAIEAVARPEDKKVILEALPNQIGLILVVAKNGWTADAHDTLMSVLKNEQQRFLPVAWIQAVASFEDPSSYPALEAYLIRGQNKQETFNAIRGLPGIDLTDAVAAAWKKAKYGPPREVLNSCAMAAEFGHFDALQLAVGLMKRDDSPEAQRVRAGNIVKRFTPATGDADAVIAWFEANQAHLAFDAKTKKFLPPSPPL